MRRKGYTVTYEMRKHQREVRRRIFSYGLCVVLAIFLAFFIIRFICFSYTIKGDAMEPTYKNGEHHLINQLTFKVKSPEQYDIILFRTEENSKKYYVKRIVGLPGDTLQIKSGYIYVNDKKTKSFSDEKIVSAGLAKNKIKLKDDEYFVVGDNYNNSEDSRSDTIGNVKRKNIIGKVSFKYWTNL